MATAGRPLVTRPEAAPSDSRVETTHLIMPQDTNSHGTARAVAAVYSAFLVDGLVGKGLRREALSTHSDGHDLIIERPSRFGLGFQLPQETRPIGPSAGSFGHFGYGGSLGFGDPETGVAFGYLMNRPGQRWQTPRVKNLISAVYDSL